MALVLSPFPNAGENDEKEPLYFAYITTFTGGFVASGGIPMVDWALELINNRSDILADYTLKHTAIENSGCNRSTALDEFFEDIGNSSVKYIGLLGCGCSPATYPVAEISHYWNILHIAWAAASIDLSNRQRYRSFFRVIPTFFYLPHTLYQLLKQFGWRQMAVITQNEGLFTTVTNSLKGYFDEDNEDMLLDTSVLFETNRAAFPHDQIFNWVDNREHRIIFINTYAEFAYEILCEAYYRGMLGPKYVWITHIWYRSDWWSVVNSSTCTSDQVLKVLNGSIGTVPDGYFIVENITSISEVSTDEFGEEYDRRIAGTGYPNTKDLAGLPFDTIWALALGLNATVEWIAQGNDSGCDHLPGDLVPLEDFNYTNEKIGCLMKQSMSSLEFTGITGNITFNADGSRVDNVYLIRQYRIPDNSQEDVRIVVANVTITNESHGTFQFKDGESVTTIWEGGVPYDGYPTVQFYQIHPAIVAVYSIVAAAGLVFVVVCLTFNIVFRQKKIIKLSSPNLNYLIILGAALIYASVYFFVFAANKNPSIQTALCNMEIWLFSIGYSLCFGVILAKSWRIYFIFNNPTEKKKIIKDKYLLIVILIIVAIDMAIILIGTAIPKSRLVATRTDDKEHDGTITEDGTIINYYIFVCISNRDNIVWLAVSYSYKALLQILAIFIAFHTRRVKIRALNDSKEIAAIIYINSIVLVLLAVVQLVLSDYHTAYTATVGLGLLIEGTLFLGLVFIPKMVSLYRDPEGEHVFTHSLPTASKQQKPEGGSGKGDIPMSTIGASNGTANNTTDTVAVLRARVKLLEEKLQSNGISIDDN